MPAITQLPPPPQRKDPPASFSDKADTFLGALPGFVNETNAAINDINGKASSASASASAAASSKNAAASSASAAKQSETNAAGSASAAAQSAESAAASASEANLSRYATAAASSAAAAKTSENNAAASATAAASSKNAAASSASAAKQSETNAAGSASAAAQSAGAAAASAKTFTSHIGTTGSAHGVATTSVNGFMSAADKSKLDSLSDRAYPRRVGGGDLNFNWNGQGGQPTWLWGGNDGTNMYVYNPSNFRVAHANTAGDCASGSALESKINSKTSFSDFASSKTRNGWQRLPNGLILQWGVKNLPVQQNGIVNADVVFPLAFPNTCMVVVMSIGLDIDEYDNSAWGSFRSTNYINTVSIAVPRNAGVHANAYYTDGAGHFAQWIAIGY